MKNRIVSALLLVILVCGLVGCSFSFTEDDVSPLAMTVTVTLKYDNGSPDSTVRLAVGERMPTPAAPKKENWLFRGWFTDEAHTKLFDFSQAINRSLTLYAGYLPDYEAWTNRLTETLMPSLVLIRTKTQDGTKTGSGIVILSEQDSSGVTYYLLTNNHVVSGAASGSILSSPFTVEDYRSENAYREVSLVARSAEYDLAVLRMRAATGMKYTLPAITLASESAAAGEAIAALGQPGGQRNALTFGHVLEYRPLSAPPEGADSIGVTFPVLYHSAPIASGSSGGAVVNFAGELVAVNFAGSYGEDGRFWAGIAIPIERTLEYLHTISELSDTF